MLCTLAVAALVRLKSSETRHAEVLNLRYHAQLVREGFCGNFFLKSPRWSLSASCDSGMCPSAGQWTSPLAGICQKPQRQHIISSAISWNPTLRWRLQAACVKRTGSKCDQPCLHMQLPWPRPWFQSKNWFHTIRTSIISSSDLRQHSCSRHVCH